MKSNNFFSELKRRITRSEWLEHAAGNATRVSRFARGPAAKKSSTTIRGGIVFAQDGPRRRSIEMSGRNFFAELKPRNVYKVRAAFARLITPR
jgi:hypothetical protein